MIAAAPARNGCAGTSATWAKGVACGRSTFFEFLRGEMPALLARWQKQRAKAAAAR